MSVASRLPMTVQEFLACEERSIRRYVILEPDSIAATVHSRGGDDWIVRALITGDVLEMPEIDVVIALADIYADVALESPATDEPPDPRLA